MRVDISRYALMARALSQCALAANGAAALPSSDMKSGVSFDHFVGGREKRRRHLQAERLGVLQVDHQFKL
jgi:hypothetical protein